MPGEDGLPREDEILEYAYAPITTHATTRMLVLHNAAYEDELAGHLEITNLDDHEVPPWKALSYAWGTPTTHARIRIGDKFIKISTNLDNALRTLRNAKENGETPDQGLRIWVDQICINQESIPERSQQVQLMYSIYSKAEEVNVWLGLNPEATARKAFFTLRLLGSLNNSQLQLVRNGDADTLAPLLGHLKVLFDLPWFSRLWIIQEVGTHTPVVLYWGQECIPFDILYQARRALQGRLRQVIYDLKVRSDFGYRLYQSFVEERPRSARLNMDFVYHLHRFNMVAGHQCLDPRDRVFALLGHYSARIGPDRHPIMQADYSLPTGRISVPSWVPNWECEDLYDIFHRIRVDKADKVQGAAGDRPLVARVIESTLQIQGFVVDTVDRLSRQFESTDPDPFDDVYYNPALETDHNLGKVWNDICGHSIIDLSTRYDVLGPSALVAFLDTCSGGWEPPFYTAEPGDRSTVMTPTKRTLDGISHLCLMLPSDKIDPETRLLADKGEPSKWFLGFRKRAFHRRFARTTRGYYTLCPSLTKEGDAVVVLMGHETPFILRPMSWNSFLLVGECYVHGIMQGQALSMVEKGEAVVGNLNIL